MPRKLNITTQSSRASSGTIYTWQRTSAQRNTSLLLLWRRSDGQAQSVSSSGMPRMGMKTPSSWTRKCSPLRSSTTTSATRFMFKSPLRCVLRVQEAITLLHHGLVGGCPIRGWHSFTFARKVWKLVPECTKRMCYKELWNPLTQLPSVVRNGSSSRTQLLSTWSRRLRSGCGGTFQHLSAPRIGPREVQTSTPWTINCGLFWRTWLAESVTTTWTAWRDPSWEQQQRSPWRWCMPRQQSGWSISRLASEQRAAILSDIIINKNLKLLLINYLAWKVYVLYDSPSSSQNPCKRTYGKTM